MRVEFWLYDRQGHEQRFGVGRIVKERGKHVLIRCEDSNALIMVDRNNTCKIREHNEIWAEAERLRGLREHDEWTKRDERYQAAEIPVIVRTDCRPGGYL